MIMEYQKILNLLDNGVSLNALNQPSKFRTKNWVHINDESREGYTTGNYVKFKTTVLKPSLCDYVNAYILVKRTIKITGEGDNDAEKQADERNKGGIFKIVPHLPNA